MAKNTAVWLPRIIFGLALLGVFLVTDMYLQEAFGRGCFSPEAADELTCDEVFDSGAGTFFGISNVLMGLLFYLVLAALRYAYAAVKPGQRETVRKASFALATVGFLYSAYLTYYQHFSSELADVASCKLCLASALTATVLFILHIVEHRRTISSMGMRPVDPPSMRWPSSNLMDSSAHPKNSAARRRSLPAVSRPASAAAMDVTRAPRLPPVPRRTP